MCGLKSAKNSCVSLCVPRGIIHSLGLLCLGNPVHILLDIGVLVVLLLKTKKRECVLVLVGQDASCPRSRSNGIESNHRPAIIYQLVCTKIK